MEYIETFVNSFKSECTRKNYRKDIEEMLSFTNKSVENIRRIDLVNWKNSLQYLSTASQARKISAVKSYFSFLYENELIEENVANKLSRPKVESKPKDSIKKEDVLKMIEVATNPRDKAIVALYLSTGMRVQELIDIQLEDYINDSEHLVFKTKGGKYRKVTLNSDCQKYIDDYLRIRKDGVPNLFVSNMHGCMKAQNISNTIKKLAKKIGYEGNISNHSLRATFITDIAVNHGIVMAQRMVNHSNVSTTQRYVRGIEEQAQEIMAQITLI